MTYVPRCACGEPQVACCCHLRAPAAPRHTCHSPYCWMLSCAVCASCAACGATLAPRDPVRLVDDTRVAADDPLRAGVEVLRDPRDLDVEASFARVRDRLRRLVLDTPAVPQADEWVVAGMVACDDASEHARHRRESGVRPLRRDGAS